MWFPHFEEEWEAEPEDLPGSLWRLTSQEWGSTEVQPWERCCPNKVGKNRFLKVDLWPSQLHTVLHRIKRTCTNDKCNALYLFNLFYVSGYFACMCTSTCLEPVDARKKLVILELEFQTIVSRTVSAHLMLVIMISIIWLLQLLPLL